MLKKYLSIFSIFLLYCYTIAQITPPTPPPGGPGGIGTNGAQATPIDEYTIYLVGFAILMAVVYFAVKKYKKSLI